MNLLGVLPSTALAASRTHANPYASALRRLVRAGACQHFTTVLSPDYDSNHHDHFHVDLARRGSDGLKTVCK